ncbi:hypothetical protein EXU85_17125 [Spirosoma sp. KCTC 42546]|uniref:hypothetical protein n=1 Tax=Spirosoma sp. KCTC 42546 TaxID=2520506 RepID=UPI00115B0BBA|nr:hypothetical protein [Spirosoma sp. KCTC 42546]QDK80231.1 hypothetical protein EXU85_17125 [Spirosoma sp. KCTC 42546]
MKLSVSSILLLLIVNTSCSNRIVYCGQNKTDPVVIRKNPEKAYFEYVKQHTNDIKLSLKYLNILDIGGVSANTKSEITTLREKLNQQNIFVQEVLKSSFFAFSQNPCNKEVVTNHLNILQKFSESNKTVKDVTTTLEKLTNSVNFSNDIESTLNNLNKKLK